VLVVVIVRRVGAQALHGAARAAAVGVGAGAVAASAGLGTLRVTHAAAIPEGILCGAVVGVVFLVVAYLGDQHDVRPMVRRLVRKGAVR
jgi:hypothetical protein